MYDEKILTIYNSIILKHSRSPQNQSPINLITHQAIAINKFCGDEVHIFIKLGAGLVSEVSFKGTGCSISQASASMLMEAIEGKTVEQIKEFNAHQMLELFQAQLTPNRQKCCLLPWRVVQTALFSSVDSKETD